MLMLGASSWQYFLQKGRYVIHINIIEPVNVEKLVLGYFYLQF